MQPSLGKSEEPMDNSAASTESGAEPLSSQREANENASGFREIEKTQSPSFISTKVIIRDSEGNWSLNTANNSLDQSSDKKSNNKLKKNSEESGANTKMNSGQQQESPDGNLLANRFELAGEAAPGTDPQAKQHLNENEFEGAPTIYVGIQRGVSERSSTLRRRKLSQAQILATGSKNSVMEGEDQRVQFILGEELDKNTVVHPIFSEYLILTRDGNYLEWKETARWIKFEENVEEGGNRWSKPHVATLALHSLFRLRELLSRGVILLDLSANHWEAIVNTVCDHLMQANTAQLESHIKELIRDVLLRPQKHQYEYKKRNTKLPLIRSLVEIRSSQSSSSKIENCGLAHSPTSLNTKFNGPLKQQHGSFLTVPPISNKHIRALSTANAEEIEKSSSTRSLAQANLSATNRPNVNSSLDETDIRGNFQFMRKIPPGAEASNILVGEVEFLRAPVTAFIRLKESHPLANLTEVPIPTRFIFILLGPVESADNNNYHEIGRAMATLMSDEIFHEVAYRAQKQKHLLSGLDEFLDAVTVLPPGEWDPSIRLEPPAAIPSQEIRKRSPENPPPPDLPDPELEEEEEEKRQRIESGLTRSGRLFGGLINDIKRKKPWYLSDYRDAFSMQCVASWIFLYFACLSPIITFGGLLSQATGRNMAAMESLVSGFLCGVGYGLFSGQPLTILGSTGPVLVFETIVYEFCQRQDWDYMTFRLWIGTWIAIILLILTAIDASALVCYITRFTEENFATLIAFIFICKAVENVLKIGKQYPINQPIYDCVCSPSIGSNNSILDYAKYNKEYCLLNNGTLVGQDCDFPDTSNVFLMSILLFLGTFTISTIFKDFRNALFFPSIVRQYISDFSVIIAIVSMTALDYMIKVNTPKLEVPHEFKPTLPSRNWVIPVFTEKNPYWSIPLAIIPALLGTILIFMDQQITAVIVNRKENKLRKGCGYHLDLFILSILIQICSIMGLPWFVAATVLSINHVNSLKQESECSAPGEKPRFLGVREQRLTNILIFLTIGLSVFLTPILRCIPMPVLFGVFLYMGVASLKGLQFFDRILIIFMPAKYQPDYMYLRKVPIKRVHLFTFIQLTCLSILWLIKSFSSTSILFPLMLVVMIGIRKSLDLIFTRRELKILDDIMPETTKPTVILNKDQDHQLENGSKIKAAASGAHKMDTILPVYRNTLPNGDMN